MALVDSYIDLSYFNREYVNIPDIGNDVTDAEIEPLVTEWQSEFLRTLFGYTMSRAIISDTNFAADPIRATDSNYTNLIQGIDYEQADGVDVPIVGLTGYFIDTSGVTKLSPIANYCYWKWNVPISRTQTTGVGEMASNIDNSMRVSSFPKSVRAWNEMVDWLWIMHEYIVLNKVNYPDYVGLTYEPVRNPINYDSLQANQKLFVKQNEWSL